MKKIFSLILILSFTLHARTLTLAQSTGLSISPPVTEILLAPSKEVIQAITVTNQADTGQFVANFHAVTPKGNDGHVTVNPEPLDPATTPLLLTLKGANIRLGEPFALSQGVQTTLVVGIEGATVDATQDVYFALVITPELDTKSSTPSTLPGIASLFFVTLTPSGSIPLDLSIENFELPYLHDNQTPLPLTPTLKNSGTSMLRPLGKLEILSPRGNHNNELKLYPNLVLGNSSRQIYASDGSEPPKSTPLIWEPNLRNFGPYRFRLTINTEGGTKLVQIEKTVWLFPLKSLFIFVLILITGTIFMIRAWKNTHSIHHIDTEKITA